MAIIYFHRFKTRTTDAQIWKKALSAWGLNSLHSKFHTYENRLNDPIILYSYTSFQNTKQMKEVVPKQRSVRGLYSVMLL